MKKKKERKIVKKAPKNRPKKPAAKFSIANAKKSVPAVEEEFKIRKVKVRVVGLGGGGSAVVSEISSILKSQSFIACDTDIRTAKKIKRGVKFFQFGSEALQGMGTGTNTDLAKKLATEEQEKIRQIFKGQDICILIGCLGGGVASGAGPIFAQAAKEEKCLSIGIFTLPFSFEGDKKTKVAKKAIAELKDELSGIIVVSNEKIFQLTDRKISLKKALSFLNQAFAWWLVELLDVVFKPSLINIDFADLKAILKDRGHTLFFSQAQANGQNRVEEVIKNIFQNNLLSDPPKNVKRILFSISGGKDLKLKEIELISEEIARLNPKAKIIFGVSQTNRQKEKIKVILLAVCEEDKRVRFFEEKPETAGDKNAKKKADKNSKEKKKPGKEVKAKPGGLEKNPLLSEKPRKTAVEVAQADEEAERIEWASDADWDIPAYLRNSYKK